MAPTAAQLKERKRALGVVRELGIGDVLLDVIVEQIAKKLKKQEGAKKRAKKEKKEGAKKA